MSILTNGDNIEFVNDPSRYPVQFLLNDGTGINQASTATLGDAMFISGYGHFYKKNVYGPVTANRTRPSAVQVMSVNSGNPAEITVGTIVPGKTIRFRIELKLTYGMKVEFFNSSGTGANTPYGRTYWFHVVARTGDTSATILQRLADQINEKTYEDFGTYPFTADYGVTTAAEFTIKGTDPDYTFLLTAWDEIDMPTTQLTVFAPVTDQPAYEGLGTYATLHTLRLETEARNEPYMERTQEHERAYAGGYDFVQWKMLVNRDELAYSAAADSGPVTQLVTYSLYIRHGSAANETFLTNLLTFLSLGGSPNASAVTKTYYDNTGTSVALGAAGSAGTFLAAAQAA